MITRKKLYSYMALFALLMVMMIPFTSGCGGSSSSSGGSSSGSTNGATETYRYAYVTNYGDNTLGFISLADNSYKEVSLGGDKAVTVGSGPSGVAVEARGTTVYVTSVNDSTVSIVNVLNKSVVSAFNPGSGALGIDFGPFVDSFAAIACSTAGSIAIWNTKSNVVASSFNVGGTPLEVATSPDGYKAYVSNSNSTISVVDVTGVSPSLLTAISNAGNGGLDVDAANTYIYAANSATNEVFKINIASSTLTSKVAVGQSPYGVACNPKNANLVYVANTQSNSVSVIDATQSTAVATIPVGTSPKNLAVTADGTMVYVANSGSNNVSVINTSTNTVTATVNTGKTPTAITTSPF
jgi:YVTN family beta-propeller protein